MDDMPKHAGPDSVVSGSLADWARAACVRAVKTAAQAAVAAIPASAVTVGGVDWRMVAGTAALAAVLSALTSIAGLPEVASGASIRQITSK